jgi:hypothetical protein
MLFPNKVGRMQNIRIAFCVLLETIMLYSSFVSSFKAFFELDVVTPWLVVRLVFFPVGAYKDFTRCWRKVNWLG